MTDEPFSSPNPESTTSTRRSETRYRLFAQKQRSA
jgi:hypothetical protein